MCGTSILKKVDPCAESRGPIQFVRGAQMRPIANCLPGPLPAFAGDAPQTGPRPYIKASTLGPGLRRSLTAFERRRFVARLDAHERAGQLPTKHRRLGEALLNRLGSDGQCDPSHATLALDTGYCVRTVQRGLKTMRWLGLVEWENRIVRDGEWAAHQTSNSYTLHPEGLVQPGFEHWREERRVKRAERAAEVVLLEVRMVSLHDGHSGRQTEAPSTFSAVLVPHARGVSAQIAALALMTAEQRTRMEAHKAAVRRGLTFRT